jgi:hypothetical protein
VTIDIEAVNGSRTTTRRNRVGKSLLGPAGQELQGCDDTLLRQGGVLYSLKRNKGE